ncbi:amidohydrolase family protein [Kribbella solani]|uniref:amidohydrolase family protein n=1 Tax=Kribbella solani TaxID=236067 RepID=UPI0029BC942C|nr:amidohydrolase family protein [Kribbella solani]MDX2970411.1 amidohydrolase family protein [Kribbella solani]
MSEVTSEWFDARIVTGAHPAGLLPPTDADSIATHLERYALSGALVSSMASWLHDPIAGNAEASAVARTLAHRGVRACWTAVPATPGELDSLTTLVDRAIDNGVAAFRIHPLSHGYSPGLLTDLYAALQPHHLPLCIDSAELGWSDLSSIAAAYPELPIVVSSLGYRKLRELGAALTAHANLHVDLVDFASHQGIEWLAANGLADRLLFATGLGVRDPGESIARLAWSGVDDPTVRLVGSLNAGRLFSAGGAV